MTFTETVFTKENEKIVRNEIKRRDILENSNNFGAKLFDGWKSTSKETPALSGIYKSIENGEVLSFIDKYHHMHTGVVASVNYMPTYKGYELGITVVCYETDYFDKTKMDFTNYGMRAKYSKDERIISMRKDKELLDKLNSIKNESKR